MDYHGTKQELTMKQSQASIEMVAISSNNEEFNEPQHVANADDRIDTDSTNQNDTRDEELMPVAMKDLDDLSNPPPIKNSRIVDIIGSQPDSRAISSCADARADPAPIMGYADEPLLPLLEACAPLSDIIYNILFYAQAALNETSEKPADGLTIDESAAIRLYTVQWDKSYRSLYIMLNHILINEDRDKLRPYFKYLKLFLTALVKIPCVPRLTIWRGVTKNLSADHSPNTSITWWRFSSCTTELPVLKSNVYLGNSGDRTLFSVDAINARKIDAHSHFVEESEVLLLPGTRMIVQSQVSPASDLHIIHLKQVVPQEILLEPPFQGKHHLCNDSFSFILFSCVGATLYPTVES